MKQIDLLDKAYQGMGLSRYTGFELMKCVDVDDYGVIKINSKPVATAVKSGETFSSLPFQINHGRTSASSFLRFCIGSGFIKYWNTTNAEWTAMASVTTGTSSNFFSFGFFAGSNTKDFMIYPSSTDGNLNAFDCSTTASPSVSSGFITTLPQGAVYKPFFTASNNRLYIGAGRFLSELLEKDGQTFAPGTPATFTFTAQKLKLGASHQIHCLAEWNEYLVIGTKNPANPEISDVFLWDMVSPSFERKISVNVPGGVNSVFAYKNYIFIQAGNKGEWFVTAGGGVEKIAEIPPGIITPNTNIDIYPGGVASAGDRIYFGAKTYDYSGVWSFDTRLLGESYDPVNRGVQPCQLEHTMSTGVIDNVSVGALQRSGTGILAGWSSTTGETTTHGIDAINLNTDSQKLYSDSEAVIISRFYQLSGINSQSVQSELHLAKPLRRTGDSITIYYRANVDTPRSITGTAWMNAGSYSEGDQRKKDDIMYVCIELHNASADKEPGAGENWETYWREGWRLYKTITGTSHKNQRVIQLPSIPAHLARHIQFMYILDAPTSQTTGPELKSHLLYA